MALLYVASADEPGPLRTPSGIYSDNTRADASAVSWGAIVAGAAAAAALSLILLILGIPTRLGRVAGCHPLRNRYRALVQGLLQRLM